MKNKVVEYIRYLRTIVHEKLHKDIHRIVPPTTTAYYSQTKPDMKTLLSLAALLGASFPAPALAEFRRFDGDIAAASNYIHYSEGYVVAPGYVDVSDLAFAASADDGVPENEDEREWNDDVSAGLVYGTSVSSSACDIFLDRVFIPPDEEIIL